MFLAYFGYGVLASYFPGQLSLWIGGDFAHICAEQFLLKLMSNPIKCAQTGSNNPHCVLSTFVIIKYEQSLDFLLRYDGPIPNEKFLLLADQIVHLVNREPYWQDFLIDMILVPFFT